MEVTKAEEAPLETVVMRYVHDCSNCIPLGQYEEFDLYFCGGQPTVVARWGDKGSQYQSGLHFARGDNPIKSLRAALDLAVALKLIDA